MNLKQTEIIILLSLWTLSLISYPIAWLNNYVLHNSDIMGLLALSVTTIVVYCRPDKSFSITFFLLLLGSFNIFSFVYFINLVVTFGFSGFVSPGIQAISMSLLITLIAKRRQETLQLYQDIFGITPEDKAFQRQQAKERFKRQFAQLSDEDIQRKLEDKLVPEAYDALHEILRERNDA